MISILIVSHNSRDHLAHCLEQLATLTSLDCEILVFDNASSDGSPELVEARFPHCRLLKSATNLGFGTANNRAAAVARGEHLLLLNSDAWIAAEDLARLLAALQAQPLLALVAPQLRYPDGRLQFTWVPETGVVGEAVQMQRNRFESRALNHHLVRWVLRGLLGPGWYCAACVLVRRHAFLAVGGFDEDFFLYFEDVDLCRRLHLAGFTSALVPTATAFHVKGGSARRSDAAEVAYRASQLAYYRKHRPRWENRYLHRRLQRKFAQLDSPELRTRLLRLLADSPADGANQLSS